MQQITLLQWHMYLLHFHWWTIDLISPFTSKSSQTSTTNNAERKMMAYLDSYLKNGPFCFEKSMRISNFASVDFSKYCLYHKYFSHRFYRIYTLSLKGKSWIRPWTPYLSYIILAMLTKHAEHCYVFNNCGVTMKFILLQKPAPPWNRSFHNMWYIRSIIHARW